MKICIFLLSISVTTFLLSCTSSQPNSAGAQACTLIGCVDGMNLKLEPNKGWQAGRYDFEIVLDEQKVSCSAELPLNSCQISNPCDNPQVQLSVSGCMLSAAQQSLPQFYIQQTNFTKLSVKISFNGTQVAEQSFSPQFKTSYPNGPSCGPACVQAPEQTMQF